MLYPWSLMEHRHPADNNRSARYSLVHRAMESSLFGYRSAYRALTFLLPGHPKLQAGTMHSASVRRSGRTASQSESPMLASENLPRLSPEGPSFASPGFCSPIVQQTQISECAALLTLCILVFPLKMVWRCVSDDPGRCSIIVTGSLNKRLCRRLPHFERPTAHRRKSI